MDPYNKKKKCVQHERFKQRMNEIFVDLLLQHLPYQVNVLYMDAESAETTKALKHLNYTCYVVNNILNVVNHLQQHHPELTVCHGDIIDILNKQWNQVEFQAVYFDACASRPEIMIDMIRAFFNRQMNIHQSIIVGYTLIGRARDGRSQLSRTQDVAHELNLQAVRLKMNLLRVCDMKNYVDVTWLHNGIFTEFFVFEPMQKKDDKQFLDINQIETIVSKTIECLTKKNDLLSSSADVNVTKKISNGLQIIPVGPERLPGKCCIIGCFNIPSHEKANVCDDPIHRDFKTRADGRMREKRRRKKTTSFGIITKHPKYVAKDFPNHLSAKSFPAMGSKNSLLNWLRQ